MKQAPSRRTAPDTAHPETLLIHLGGLGDVCLSESTFVSLAGRFEKGLVAAGYSRFLNLFEGCFSRVADIDKREWLYLFSGEGHGETWKQIVFIGKDRDGAMRRRLQGFSVEPLLFIDMYPDETIVHVEQHQLSQVACLGINPVRKEPDEVRSSRIIIYPEREREKTKWPVDHFLEVYRRLYNEAAGVVLLEPVDLDLAVAEKVRIEDLRLLADFLAEGGLFVSNDCGLAHLAATRGMSTVTLFYDHDPRIWHPRGRSLPVICTGGRPTPEEVTSVVLDWNKKALPGG